MKMLRFWLPAVVWMSIIFLFSMRQRVEVSENDTINFLFFKTLHVLEYSFLYLLLFRACKYTVTAPKKALWYIAAFIITVAYAVTDEIHQTFIPTREGSLRDVIIDAAGASIAWISIKQLLPKMPPKLRLLVNNWQLI